MQREQLTLQSSLKPFFGGSDATAHFVAANYFTSNFYEPVNTATDPKRLLGTVLENVMFTKNFEEASKAQGMRGAGHDNDIHNQFVDFIVRTASFHKEFDNPTTIGSGLSAVRDSFTEAADKALNQSIFNIPKGSDILNLQIWGTYSAMRNVFPSHPNVSKLTLADMGLNVRSTYFDYVNTVLLCLIPQLDQSDVASVGTLLAKQMYFTDLGVSGAHGAQKTVREILQSLIGHCDDNAAMAGGLGNFCLMSYWNPLSASPAGQNVKNILSRLGASGTNMMDKFNDVAIEVLSQYCLDLFVNVGGFAVLKQAWSLAYANDDASIFVDMMQQALRGVNGNATLKQGLSSAFADRIYDVIAGTINNAGVKQYRTLDSNEAARRIYESVFGNWERLDAQARNFYRAHLHVFRKARGGAESGWVDLMENDDFKPVQASMNELRLNLTHSRPGARDTLFSYTLPFLPVDNVGALWYTDASGIVKSVPHERLDVNVFKTIYDSVYLGLQCNVGGQVLNFLPYNRLSDKDFDLDDILILRNFVKAQKEAVPNVAQSGHASFDDLYVEDMTTHVVYARDENGNLFRNVNGQRVYASDDTIRVENCAGTALKGDKQCVRFVYECILNGNPDNLSHCLDRMADENLFNVAQNEFQNIDAKMAIQVLKALGVKKNIEQHAVFGKIAVPESFESWKSNFVARIADPVKRAAIDRSVNFNRYVRGVIAFVRQNPTILNTHVKAGQGQNVQDEPTDAFLKALGKTRWFINPLTGPSDSRYLLNGFTPSFAIPNVAVQMPYPNAFPAGNVLAPFGMMRGGRNSIDDTINRKISRHELSSDLIDIMFTDVNNCLKNAGIMMTDIDQKRITNGIEQIKSIEKRSFELYNMLRTLATIAQFFRSTGCASSNQIVELSINNLKNRGDTLAYLQNNIEGLQSCIGSGLNQQNSVCNELVKTFSDLFSTAAKQI